jgi:cyclin K
MRYSLQHFHRQDVAAACVFLATKTEECGRKLRDVAKVYHSKLAGIDPGLIPSDSKEVDQYQTAILVTEEYLLQAICFDFAVESPHAELVDLFVARPDDRSVQDYAWTFAHDS